MSARLQQEVRQLRKQLSDLEDRVVSLEQENRGGDPPIRIPPFPRGWLSLGFKPPEGVEVG